jgi:hypothetical protein
MTAKLRISPDLALPLDAVTQTFAILAKRRVGKTYTGSVMAEEFVAAKLPFVAIDPTGAWWGLRASADGERAGLPVVIIGGAHGDVPLEPTAGKVIADLVVDHPGYYVLDLSLTESDAAQDRFATDFAVRLYRRKESARFPLHLFVDEADSFAPQRPQKGQERMLGAFEALIRRGGIRGIGMTMITQRPAVLNKNVLTQAETLIALQVTAPQDQDAIDDWVKRNGTKEQRDQLMGSLASLGKGDAWVWSPAWLDVFKRVHIRERKTFNSSATPEVGAQAVEPKKLAAVDLDALRTQMAATIEHAKENDPQLLQQRIRELEAKLKKGAVQTVEKPGVDQAAIDREVQRAVQAAARANAQTINALRKALEAAMKFIINVSTQKFDVAGIDKEELERAIGAALVKATDMVERRLASREAQIDSLRLSAQRIASQLKAALGDEETVINVEVAKNEPYTVSAPPRPEAKRARVVPIGNGEAVALPVGERATLIACAQYPDGADRTQISILTQYKRSSRDAYISRLVAKGFVEVHGGVVVATDDGLAALGSDFEPLPTGEALRDHWLGILPEGERRVLEVLLAAYPGWVSRQAIDDETGYKRSSRDAYLSRLGARKLVTTSSAGVQASAILFEEE